MIRLLVSMSTFLFAAQSLSVLRKLLQAGVVDPVQKPTSDTGPAVEKTNYEYRQARLDGGHLTLLLTIAGTSLVGLLRYHLGQTFGQFGVNLEDMGITIWDVAVNPVGIFAFSTGFVSAYFVSLVLPFWLHGSINQDYSDGKIERQERRNLKRIAYTPLLVFVLAASLAYLNRFTNLRNTGPFWESAISLIGLGVWAYVIGWSPTSPRFPESDGGAASRKRIFSSVWVSLAIATLFAFLITIWSIFNVSLDLGIGEDGNEANISINNDEPGEPSTDAESYGLHLLGMRDLFGSASITQVCLYPADGRFADETDAPDADNGVGSTGSVVFGGGRAVLLGRPNPLAIVIVSESSEDNLETMLHTGRVLRLSLDYWTMTHVPAHSNSTDCWT